MLNPQDPQQERAQLYEGFTQSEALPMSGSMGIKQFSYPSDLGSAGLKHYVRFDIFIRGKSKYNKTNTSSAVPSSINSVSEQELSRPRSEGLEQSRSTIGDSIATKISKLVGRSGNAQTTDTPIDAPPVTAVNANGTNAYSFIKPDTSVRISDVISLFMAEPPTVKYAMNYANKDLGTIAGVLANAARGVNVVGESAGAAAQAAAAAVARAASVIPGVPNAIEAGSAVLKVALNPFKEVLFESVDFRSFAFRFKFLPKNQDEVNTVQEIIRLFKFHMHPEFADSKTFFIYPSEFDITYCHGANTPNQTSEGERNTYFHKFARCVLDNMEVTYGGEQFSSFRGGKPTEINITLIFRETEILTKEKIAEGY